jgi:hypothetical protein
MNVFEHPVPAAAVRGGSVALCALLAGLSACMGPTFLFDGATLSGWQAVGEADWSVQDRAIVASGAGDGFLASTGRYGDFHLRLEFWIDATTNSGIFIRCSDPAHIHPDTCYELNIWDEHPRQEARTGAIVFRVMPPLAQVHTVGRWNTFEVTAMGQLIEVRVNGETTAVLEDADPAPGLIALQHWGEGTVKFRDIELYLR